ncbi:MAG: septum formation initiator family protein [Candidatus Bipolaricaulia bacterium]
MGAISRSVIRRRERIRRIVILSTLVAFLLLVLGVGYLFLSRQWAIARLRAELWELDRQGERLLQERAALEGLFSKRFDREYIEYLARKELGLIKPGEEKYIVVEDK